MSVEVPFEFGIEDQVTMNASDRVGTVVALLYDRDRIKWNRVEYLLDTGEVKEDWFRQHHLTRLCK